MENKELAKAWRIITETDTHLFLTGRAGTGKTTFLRQLRTLVPKRMIVLAPTGVAAINAQGTTIHSFFQLPFGPQPPGTHHATPRYAYRKNKLQIIRSIDLLVIDEISMVRADTLDAIDQILRRYRDRTLPFGGVQMLMIGDTQQLPPVARDDEWAMLHAYYDTPYFFSSRALRQCYYTTVELKHVYRQKDPRFVDILNKVRDNTLDATTLQTLNQRYIPNFHPRREDGYIHLTTHIAQADHINQSELARLSTPSHTFSATIEGDFPENSFPTDKKLLLKEGAQVMFIKNDPSPQRRYYNGMIAEVVAFDDEKIQVLSNDSGEMIEVDKARWENIRYTLDEETHKITEDVVGCFVQYPLKTAWAITIHKSQGLTFAKAIIDVHHSFAHGQTYVALSRCTTLEGLVLSSPVSTTDIINDNTITAFNDEARQLEPDDAKIDAMQRQYMLRTLDELYGMQTVRYAMNDLLRFMREHFYGSQPKLYAAWQAESDRMKEVETVATKFHTQYERLLMTADEPTHDEHLQERLKKGAAYFADSITTVKALLKKTVLKTNNKQTRERRDTLLATMRDALRMKQQLLTYVEDNGFTMEDYRTRRAHLLDDMDKPEPTTHKTKKEGGRKK